MELTEAGILDNRPAIGKNDRNTFWKALRSYYPIHKRG
ncbi:hypothetical protein MmTuc01_1112 [Methanosarcina mazei Tuc01]|uniref:Uncharacterized protein n=1 Tax=Methanosarcina mazei Tuc01 TaxID=1236903 RepID=M1P7W7_METMZ|nr:hypothetical protein MmTuc01_1112 [Methanosarcina mazei Tuc01]